MSRFAVPVSVAVGGVSAIGLSAIRGGYQDAPWVLVVFGGTLFLISYAIFALQGSRRIAAFEAATTTSTAAIVIRDLAAVFLLILAAIFSGPIAQSAMYAGWLVAMLMAILFPLCVCLVTYHMTILMGVLSAVSIVASCFLHDQLHSGWRLRSHFSQQDIFAGIIACVFLAGLSLAVSVPIAVRRRRAAGNTGRSLAGQADVRA